VKIRRYNSADEGGLLSFLKGVFDEMGFEFPPDGKDADIRDIDHVYTRGRNCFYVVEKEGEICGCVGVRRLSEEIAEFKRLYLASGFRGQGIGRALCVSAINDARNFGYRLTRLDTTAKSSAALALFRKLGFYEIARYNANPLAKVFMEKAL
jgi:ribosomal protein S18 acetylase RimI-like enzyme